MLFKNFTAILAILLLNVCQLVAQGAGIDWYKSKSSLGKDYFNALKVLDANKDFIWYVRGTGRTPTHIAANVYGNRLTLAKFDITKDTTYTCDLNFKINEYNLDFLYAVQQKGVLNVFSTFWNRKDDKLYLFKESYDLNTLRSNNDIMKVLEIDISKKMDIKRLSGYTLKFDNNRYVFYYTCDTKNGDYAGVEVLNEKFVTEWKTFQPIAVQAKFYGEECFKIDGQGNVYMLGRGYKSTKDTRKNFSKSTISVVCYPKSGEKLTVRPIVPENKYFVSAAHLAITKKDEIIVAGMYANAGLTSAIGCFSKIYDIKLENEKSNYLEPFTTEMLAKGEDRKVVSLINKNKEFDDCFDYSCDSIHIKENGDFDYVIEKARVIIKTHRTASGLVEFSYSYVFDDIYAMSFSSNGSVKWVQKAPKNTFLLEPGSYLGGYSLFYDKSENIHLIFNAITEKAKVFSDFTKPNRKGPTTHVIFDKDGNEKVSILSDTPDVSNYICPLYAIKTTNNTILIPRFPFLLGGTLSKKNNNIEFGELKLD